MVLTQKQEEGLKIALERFKNKEPYTCIAGLAGSGKTTLVHFIIDAMGLDPVTDVYYTAYTGRATQVLQSKGNPNATTTHRLLYDVYFVHKTGECILTPKRYLGNYKLIVVDEISMLPKELWNLLLSHHIPIIALGDPFQLPPIGGDNGILAHAHIFLDEIMRQAQESEIIRLSMDVRNGKSLPLMKGKEVQIFDKKDFVDGMLTWADQVLCGKNKTRHMINTYVRQQKFPGKLEPQVGDKIICLRNNWKIQNGVGDFLTNGLTGQLTKISLTPQPYTNKKMVINFNTDLQKPENTFVKLSADYNLFLTGEPTINKKTYTEIPRGFHPKTLFDYAYAITVHKAQGGEYSKVLVLDETLYGTEYARWLYTAITRAVDRLTIIRNY